MLPSHGILAAIELPIFTLLLIPQAHNLLHYGIRRHTSFLLLLLFSCIKIVGCAMQLHVSQHPLTSSIGLQVAMQICYQIALGPLLSSTVSFLNPREEMGEVQRTPSVTSTVYERRKRRGKLRRVLALLRGGGPSSGAGILQRVLRVTHVLVVVGIILGIVGAVDRAPTSTGLPRANYNTGATLLKASALLMTIALVGITVATIVFWRNRNSLDEPQRTLLLFVALAVPLFVIRIAYSLLSCFNLSTTTKPRTLKWNMFYGDVTAYTCMAMVEQIGVVVLYTVAGYVARRRTREALCKNSGAEEKGIGKGQDEAEVGVTEAEERR